MFSLPMCIERADSIKTPLNRPAAGPWFQVWLLHTSAGPQTSEVAARPLGPDGRPIHTSRQLYLWSQEDLNPASARISSSVSQSPGIKRKGCLQFRGICASGRRTSSTCITKDLCRWTTPWIQVGGSGIINPNKKLIFKYRPNSCLRAQLTQW